MKRKSLIVTKKVERKNYLITTKDHKVKNFYTKFKNIVFEEVKKENFAIAVSGGSDSLCLAYFSNIYSSEFNI